MTAHRSVCCWIRPCAALLCLGATSAPAVRFTDITLQSGIDFEHASSATSSKHLVETMGGGVALLDFDNDGNVDVVVNNLDGPPTLLRNDGGNRNHWIMIKCVGAKSNRSGIGARVQVTAGGRRQIDEVMSGSSYYSHNDLRLHFGLGRAVRADLVEIAWPSGEKSTFRDLDANRLYVCHETQGIVGRHPFGSK